jgi:hypothetical protein
MVQDLSYLTEQPSEAQEEAIKRAVEKECLKAIATYLVQLTDIMKANDIAALTEEQLLAMAQELDLRVKAYDVNTNDENQAD